MDDELAEWKAQRAEVARHLAWLDTQIARRSAGGEVESLPEAPAPALPLPAPAGFEEVLPSTAGPMLQATHRMGCLLLALLAAGAVLFVLFVLPEFLYD